MLRRALIVAVAATLLPMAASAQTPIVFVHGNGDHAGLWDNVIWRFESNGYPSSRLFAVDLPNPSASSTLTAVELNRSTPEEQTAALAAFVTRVLLTTGAPKVALVGSSRGGMTIRNYVRYGGGAAHVSHVITSGTPNHGVFAIPTVQPNGEFNGAGPYLRALNRGSEVVPGVKFLALRSDSLDKFAQADGAGLGMKGTPTNVDANGPALRGAMNVVLPGTDHREVAFGPAAFRAQYRFITGRTPTQMDIVADTVAVLAGMISGHANASPTNLPVANAVITVHAVDAATGQRLGAPAYRAVTSHTGRWGPFHASPTTRYEFEVANPDSTVLLHVFRMPFPRSSRVVNFRFSAPPAPRPDSVSVLIARPRGYLGLGRDTVEFDGTRALGIPAGVPTVDRAIRWFGAREPISVRTRVNGETLVVRTQPSDKRRLVSAEFQRE
jgi:pimeloyl-ACP methyl ester carboxylesterase